MGLEKYLTIWMFTIWESIFSDYKSEIWIPCHIYLCCIFSKNSAVWKNYKRLFPQKCFVLEDILLACNIWKHFCWSNFYNLVASLPHLTTPTPHPILRQPLLEPVCFLILKFLLRLCSFLVHPLRYFGHTPHPHATLSCPNPANQPSLVQTNIKRVILSVQVLLSIKNQFLIF